MITRDYDFIGFTFNGKHSIDDFGIYRTSDGSRYNDNLIPMLQDKVADVPNGHGQYYFSTLYKTRSFPISIAFDSLSESDYLAVRKWLKGDNIHDLIFDESPYKVYSAKVTGTPSLKTICFEVEGQRVYKGEGSVIFTCYYPFAHTPNVKKSGFDGRSSQNYTLMNYPTKDQWLAASGLPTKHMDGNNYGEIESPFIFRMEQGILLKAGDKLKVGTLEVVLEEDADQVVWDSRSGLITGLVNGISRALKFSGTSYGAIPEGGIDAVKQPKNISYETTREEGKITYCSNRTKYVNDIVSSNFQDPPFTIEYDYWYY